MKNRILILFIFLLIFIPNVKAYSNADLLPELTMPKDMDFIGMDPKVQTLPKGYFISSENVHTDYQKEYYYLNDKWYQDEPGLVASIVLPVDLSDNTLYNGNLVFCSKENFDFNKYMKLSQIYHGNKTANSYNEDNKVREFSSNLNSVGGFYTEAEDFASCYNYSFSFTTADTKGPILGFKFIYPGTGIGPNQQGMAFMGMSLNGVGLDFGSELGGINDKLTDVQDKIDTTTDEIKDNIDNSTTEINGSISNSTTNINNSINNSTSTITNEVNNMGNQISGTINDNFNSCRVSYNILKGQGLSTPITDSNYWGVHQNTLSKFLTPLEDGWAHFEYDHSQGDSYIYLNFFLKSNVVDLKPNTYYKIQYEFRNVKEFSSLLELIDGAPSRSTLFHDSIFFNVGSSLRNLVVRTKTVSDLSTARYLTWQDLYVPKGSKFNFDMRISIFEDDGTENFQDWEPYGQQICTNKLDEQNKTSKGILGTLKSVFTSIIDLPSKLWNALKGGFEAITNGLVKLGSTLLEGIKNLFLPTQDQILEIIEDSRNMASEFGFIGQISDFVIQVFTSVVSIPQSGGCIEFPGFELDFTSTLIGQKIKLWDKQNYCMSENPYFGTNTSGIDVIRLVTTITLIIAFVNFANEQVHQLFEKDEDGQYLLNHLGD